MKWSVALFGHEKPNYYMIEKTYNIRVATFQDEPTYDKENEMWRDGSFEFPESVYRLHTVVGNDRFAKPGDIIAFKPWAADVYWSELERKQFLIVTIDEPTEPQMEALCEPYFDITDYPTIEPSELETTVYLYPKTQLRKRRFHIPMPDLILLGVDTARMLDTTDVYVPGLPDISKVTAYDKMNDRYVLESDGLNLIEPIVVNPTGVTP